MRRIILATILVLSIVVPITWAGDHENEPGDNFPEMTALHEVVASIWHKHFPIDDWAAIRKELPALKEKVDALKTAKLPEGMADRAEAFKTNVDSLSKAVENLIEVAKKDDNQAFGKAVVEMHHAFHGLVSVLYSN